MEEVVIKIEVPSEFKDEFKEVLARIMKSFEKELELALVNSVLSKSKLREEQVIKLGNELKEKVWQRHKKQGW